MRRHKGLAWLFLALALLWLGSFFVRADKGETQRPMRSITVFTTIPAEEAALLSAEYEKISHIRVNFLPLSQGEILKRLKMQAEGSVREEQRGSLVLADRETLNRGVVMDYFAPHVSEVGDMVPEGLKNKDGLWTGVWYDPVIFCFNQDFLKHTPWVPNTWEALSERNDLRIGLTDFLAADAAGSVLFGMIGEFGETKTYNILSGIHPKVVQYAKFLANPVRQAGMGEVDVAIAIESETLRYLDSGYPVSVVYPANGTVALITGVAVPKELSPDTRVTAETFADWLLTDQVQELLQRNGFFFVPANPSGIAYKSFAGKNLRLFENTPDFTPGQKRSYLDRWVKDVRLK